MALRVRVKARYSYSLVPILPLVIAVGVMPAAGADGAIPASPENPVATSGSCVTTWRRPPPCQLWYWAGPAPDEATTETASHQPEYGHRHGVARTAAGVAVIVTSTAAATFLDGTLRNVVSAENPDRPATISGVGNLLGNGRIMLIATSATYGVSRLAGYEELADPAGRVLTALVGAGAANVVLKATVGRARPRLELGSSDFRPFTLENGWQSFPSGHAVTAFALATAIAAETDNVWVTALSYSAAGLVAWSRGHEDQHWVSDVVAGAALGTIAARYTARIFDPRDQGGRSPGRVRLLVEPGTVGVTVPLH